uniref:Reverse transcriptase domain-containing protein n=1 Tax=Solanum lycopersicum TaxID=4081 RepID=A0A3Q7FGV8_SOLLC
MHGSKKTIFLCPLWIRCWIDLPERDGIVFLMVIRGIIRFLLHRILKEKTTFNCPYGTFAFKRMSFGFCNAPATFQRCMTSIFFDIVEYTIEAFMDDFSVIESFHESFLRLSLSSNRVVWHLIQLRLQLLVPIVVSKPQ